MQKLTRRTYTGKFKEGGGSGDAGAQQQRGRRGCSAEPGCGRDHAAHLAASHAATQQRFRDAHSVGKVKSWRSCGARYRCSGWSSFRPPTFNTCKKALMQMNLQRHHVVSDVTGATGMKIIRVILAGTLRSVYAGGRSRPHADSLAGSVLGAPARCRVRHGHDAVADGQALHIVADSFRSGRWGQNVRSA
jgi:hypothetical protein